MKRHTYLEFFACVLSLATLSHAQAGPTASRSSAIQIGAGVSIVSPDYTAPHLKGLAIYGDYDVTQHIGVEGDIHYSVITPHDISENSYLLGPRYKFRYRRFEPYAKALFGVGRFGFQKGYYPGDATSTFFQYALGGGVDVRINRHINVRAFDIEFQQWPGFEPNGLSPVVYTFGAAYTLR